MTITFFGTCRLFTSADKHKTKMLRKSSMIVLLLWLAQLLLTTNISCSFWNAKSAEPSSSSSGQHELIFSISEGVPIGTLVGIIRLNNSQPSVEPPFLIVPISNSGGGNGGEDVDQVTTLDENAKAAMPTYSILKMGTVDTDFNIEQSTGEIRTAVLLDREQRKHYSFMAISLNGVNIHVKIIIEDVNDNAPRFSSSEIELEFPENSKARDVKRTLPPAKDRDQGVYGIQSYRIVSGNIDNAFRLISHREKDNNLYLDLQVNGVLDRESIPAYSLVIEALDGGQPPLKDQLLVKIKILDHNDCEPVFSQSHYFATVASNATVGSQLLRVTATDNDQGENGHVTYFLHFKNSGNVGGSGSQINSFAIDKESGWIILSRPLDFDAQDSYELVVVAKDQGTQPLETSALISLRVISLENKHLAINLLFLTENSKPAISEDAKVGDLVARVTIKMSGDNDNLAGSKRSKFEALLQGASNDEFTMKTQDNIVFLIVVNGKLDREQQSRYTLTVVVYENNIAANVSQSFDLEILDVNDNPPYFDQTEYHLTVPETADAGSSVFQVKAHDKDSDSMFTYAFLVEKNNHELLTDEGRDNNNIESRVSSMSSQPKLYQRFNSMNSTHVLTSKTRWFALDYRTGLIVTRTQVDCETEAEPKLTILVTDAEDDDKKKFFTATMLLRIAISDINDNEPIFDQSFYNVTVPEDTQPGHCILQISATDPDCGMNAIVNYSFATDNFVGAFSSVFLKKKTLASFDQQDFILEPNNGRLCLRKELDFERTQVYDIPVMATDRGGLSTTAMIKVQVIDTNDNYPIFYPKEYQVSLQAQAANNQMFHERVPLVIVAASDHDSPTSPYGQITYLIKSVGSIDESYFDINAYTGEIFLARQFDNQRRMKNSFQLMIIARDGGGRESPEPAIVRISLLSTDGVQQQVIPLPVFAQRQFNFQVIENVAQGALVGTIEAKLKDKTSPDQRITYGIYSGDPDGYFTIDPQQGIITVRSTKIDHERHSFLLLNVHAYCGAEPGPYRYAHAQVNITILDENDNAPMFPARYLKLSLQESVQPGEDFSTVFVAYAIDNDSEQFGQVHYSLFDASTETRSDNFPFIIEPTSGQVKLIRPLDFEKTQSYKLKIVAVDGGQLSSEMIVDVLVQDVNDNAPVFIGNVDKTIDFGNKKLPFYQFTIPENQPVNSHIYQIKATDNDSGNNARLTYSLEPLSVEKRDVGSIPIDIFPNNGMLYVKDALDRETVEQYRFMIHVTDHGQPLPLNASAIFYVQLSDINDNRPYWHQSTYNFEISEEATAGAFIGQVSAFDIDSKSEGSNSDLLYNITGTPEAIQVFRINKTSGQIYLKSSIDREKKEQYELQIEVRDQGLPHPLTSEEKALVIVKVLDINDNRPIFENSIFDYINDSSHNIESSILRVPVGTPKHSILTTFKAKDPDAGENGTVYYSLVNESSLFHLNKNTGVLTTKVNIDEQMKKQTDLKTSKNEDDGFYHISIFAQDGKGKKSNTKAIKVQIVDRRALNLNLDSIEVINFQLNPDEIEFGQNLGVINLPTAQVARHQCSGRFFTYFSLTEMDNNPFLVDSSDQNPDKLNLIVYDEGKLRKMLKSSKADMEAMKYLMCIDWQQCSTTLFNLEADNTNNGFHSAAMKLQCDHYIKLNIEIKRANDQGSTFRCLLNHKNDLYDVKIPWSNVDNGRYQQRFNNLLHLNNSIWNEECSEKEVDGVSFEVSSPIVGKDILDRLFTIGTDRTTQTLQFKSNERSLIQEHLLHQDFVLTLDIKSRSEEALQSVPIRIKLLSSDSKIGNNLVFLNENFLELEEDCCMVGSAIIQARINVSHDDFGIKYFLSSGEKQNKQHYLVSNDEQFVLNPDTGLLSLKKEFDYEQKHEHRINITAVLYDSKAAIMSVSQIVHIKLLNVNDESPVFLRSNYYKEVLESIATDQMLLRFEARDADQSPHSINITYVMPVSYEHSSYFHLDSKSGELKLIRSLDHENIEQFNVPIYAFDDDFKHSAFTLAIIKVLDVNDNAPYFVHPNITLKISERTAPATSILNLIAFDPDLFVQSNNHSLDYDASSGLQFKIISGNVGNKFSLDEQKGELSVNAPLDREMQAAYNLIVEVSDTLHTAISNVTIELLDINDNAPMFDKSEYYAILRENSVGWISVVTVRAFDSDGDKLLYSIDSTVHTSNMTRYFRMNSETGEITIHSSILAYIFRHSNVFSFDVLAIEASKALYETHVTRVKVHLTLVNGLESSYTAGRMKLVKYPMVIVTDRSPDSFRSGQTIGTFEFVDSKSSGSYSYHVIQGKEFLEYFNIQASSDTIVVKKPLQNHNYFQAIVEIRGNGDAWRYSTTTLVQIFVGKINEERFVQTVSLNASIAENRLLDNDLFDLDAVLKRYSRSYRLYYQLAYSNIDLTSFDLNRTNGSLRLARPLDYETQPSTVRVLAFAYSVDNRDWLESEVFMFNMTISLSNVDDNRPQFIQHHYIATIFEGERIGSLIGQVNAIDIDELITVIENITNTDADFPSVSNEQAEAMMVSLEQRFNYYIVDGNVDNAFTIDNKGRVSTNIVLDREIRDRYQLKIIATDMKQMIDTSFISDGFLADEANHAHLTQCTFEVIVVDVNDNGPVFPPSQEISVSEDAELGATVATWTANDVDIYPPLSYVKLASKNKTFDAMNLFDVGYSTGRIYLKYPLKAFLATFDRFALVHPVRLHLSASDEVHKIDTEIIINIKRNRTNFVPTFKDGGNYYVNYDMSNVNQPTTMHDNSNVKLFQVPIEMDAAHRTQDNKIIYSLNPEAGNDGFHIDPSLGIVYNNQTMRTHRSTVRIYQLSIFARYQQSNGKQSRASLVIVLNTGGGSYHHWHHHASKFGKETKSSSVQQSSQNVYNIVIDSSDQIGVPLIKFPRRHRQQNYAIISGNTNKNFLILRGTELVFISSPLTEHYTLKIRSLLANQRNDTLTVFVQIKSTALQPTNGHHQVSPFKSKIFDLEILENEKVGNEVQNLATPNVPNYRFKLFSGNEQDMFSVDRYTGSLTINKNLDFEHVSTYRLGVVAEDTYGSGPAHFAIVNINLINVNEYCPQFASNHLKAIINENVPIGTIVLPYQAFDRDGNIVNYTFVPFAPSTSETELTTKFRFDLNHGTLLTASSLDYETGGAHSHKFIVKATDLESSNAPLTSEHCSGPVEALFEIRIGSVDEFAPVFSSEAYEFKVATSVTRSRVKIGKVSALDKDGGPDGAIRYSLKSVSPTSLFEKIYINSTTGQISMSSSNLTSLPREYTMLVSASSGRFNSLSSIATVDVKLSIVNKLESEDDFEDMEANSSIDESLQGSTTEVTLPGWIILLVVLIVLVSCFLVFVVRMYKQQQNQEQPQHFMTNHLRSMNNGVGTLIRKIGPMSGIGTSISAEPNLSPAYQTVPDQYGQTVRPPGYSEMTPIATMRGPRCLGDPSASSGRGSVDLDDLGDLDEVDEEIRIINESSNYGYADGAEEITTTSEYLARLGVSNHYEEEVENCSTAIEEEALCSDETLDVLSEMGAATTSGRRSSRGKLLKRSKVAGLNGSISRASSASGMGGPMMMGASSSAMVDSAWAPACGSLSSIVHNEEEFSGSYNWDYLQHWGPKYQPMSSVFSEIARLKQVQSDEHQQQHEVLLHHDTGVDQAMATSSASNRNAQHIQHLQEQHFQQQQQQRVRYNQPDENTYGHAQQQQQQQQHANYQHYSNQMDPANNNNNYDN